ncbi:MAG: apolipoprotein N-acyltransferase, partial [Acidobacteria bacterium]
LLGLAVLAAVAAGLGAGRLGRSEGDVRVTVAAVQAALPREADAWGKFLAHERLTIEAARRGARLVVWPESAVPYRLDRHRGYRELVAALARRAGVDIVLNTIEADDAGRYFNAAALVRADGRPGGAYRKRRLVPFGEYLPLRSLFRRVPALAAQAGDFTPGAELVLLESRDGTVGPLVCYEAVFPALAADEAAAGADLLVNMTNDSWFGWTGGPAQHLAHARLRAAETGLPLVRAAYSGISAIFSDRGRELGRLGLGERGVLTAEVHVGGRAPGAAVGRALARLCATLAAVAAALVLVRARRADVAPDAEAGPAPEGTSRDEG